MSIDYIANVLIGVEINPRSADGDDDTLLLGGTEIPIPMQDDEPIVFTVEVENRESISIDIRISNWTDGTRLYYGYLVDCDDKRSCPPSGFELNSLTPIFSAVQTGLRDNLGFEGDVKLFCFLSFN
jgi:hypothetical protein